MKRRSDSGELDVTRRLIIAGAAGGLVAGGLLARLVNLQLMNQEEFEARALDNQISLVPGVPRRGLIYDRFGEPLATHRTSWNVYAAREDLANLEATLDRISDIVEISDERKRRLLENFRREYSFIPVSILSDLTYEQFTQLSVRRPELPGVTIEASQARSYPRGRDFAHVVGYVARANQSEIDAALDGLDPETDRARISRIQGVLKHPNMRVGRLGVERELDDWLGGTPGNYRYVRNAQGRTIQRLDDDENAPKPGRDVHLTIDADLQRAAIELFGDQTGAAVVMDVETGDILTLASNPTYDPNDFVNGISSADYSALREDERSPLYHKAYDGLYPPGSTFKMIVGGAALRAGLTTPNETVYCPGHYDFGNRRFHCWQRRGHGNVNLHEAIQKSCDVYFYEIARRLGPERIAEEAKAYGLGVSYELGMTGGAAGVVPNDNWKRGRFNEPWYDGETLNYGIGQGYLTVSPLQLAVMTSRLAIGDGSQVMPRMVGSGPIIPPSPVYGSLPGHNILDHLRSGMFAVTSETGGTALRAGDIGFEGIRMSGKTGTAQVRVISAAERATGVIDNADLPRRLRDHGLFVGFAPYDNPKYAVSVVVEHGGGSSSAYPIARDLMREAFVRNSGRAGSYEIAAVDRDGESI
ncbi:penicillin-binding protein 2 [Ponticaulis sp.]|uniref:penicillin-binding protein 2 n=1 Tax=Ponticaulis sp. TaxID=2020902 RepID=UPI000C920E18|nr:penicillin-binding protein 2 [Ponticaulis sp.]MAI90743.1 penicillin-binding protein 2 [Ponticaulis sp.]|tara:strand:+ start:27884 stop:29809 length:1926 start_codon:yes stop_codon:yes gene_type:complete